MMYTVRFVFTAFETYGKNNKIELVKRARDFGYSYDISDLQGLKQAKDFIEGLSFITSNENKVIILMKEFDDKITVQDENGNRVKLSDLNSQSNQVSTTEATEVELKDLTLFIDASAWYKTLDDAGKKHVDVLTKMLMKLSK